MSPMSKIIAQSKMKEKNNECGKELLCSKCRKRVLYHIFRRPAKTVIKDIEKRPLSKLLGFGELTITRYLDGQLPSVKYSNILFQVLRDEQKMKQYVESNSKEVSVVAVNKVKRAIEKCETEKKYNNSAEKIALYIISSGREITNLLLQKILYYVKAISKIFEGESFILEPCEAWKFGPVFPSVYEKYREFGKQEIKLNLSKDYISELLSEEEKTVTDFVMNTFGIYNAWFLKDLTHLEEPWIVARKGLAEDDASRNQMDEEIISNYFAKMNQMYDLKTAVGVEVYINHMKKKCNDVFEVKADKFMKNTRSISYIGENIINLIKTLRNLYTNMYVISI